MTDRAAMTPEQLDRERLRGMARDKVPGSRPPKFMVELSGNVKPWVTSAFDAAALWGLLAEPTCLLCGAERDVFGGECDCGSPDCGPGPDAGSVLCQRCREGR